MSGHRKFSELREGMAPERRARNVAAAERVLAEMPLGELRQARELTGPRLRDLTQ